MPVFRLQGKRVDRRICEHRKRTPSLRRDRGWLTGVWQCLDGPPEWIGTDITFSFAREGAETVVRFAHRNWREASDAFAQCTTKWGRVLMALKSRVETPEADDLRV